MLELHPSYVVVPTKKRNCKVGLVGPGSPKSLEMFFTLLTKIVIVYVQFTILYIRHFSLRESFALCWRLIWSLVRLQISFHELFEQFIDKGRSGSWSGERIGAKAGVGAEKTAGEGVGVLLSLVEAPGRPLTSLSSPSGRRLW